MKVLDLEKPIAEYEKELYEEERFDKHRLDEEYEEQPRKFTDWAILYGKSLALRKKAEAAVDRAKAKIDLEVRKNPVLHGLTPDDRGKIMESAIKSVVINHEDVLTAEEYYYRIYELNKLFDTAVEAFKQRKELLRGEGELWINKYYASPVVRVKEAEKEERCEEIEQDLQEQMSRRKRRGAIG